MAVLNSFDKQQKRHAEPRAQRAGTDFDVLNLYSCA